MSNITMLQLLALNIFSLQMDWFSQNYAVNEAIIKHQIWSTCIAY